MIIVNKFQVKIIEHDIGESSSASRRQQRPAGGSSRRPSQTTGHSTKLTVRSNSHKLQIDDWEELLQSESQSSEEEIYQVQIKTEQKLSDEEEYTE